MKDSKNMVIGMLCAVVCVMAVAYAAFSTTLNVTTTATVASNWCVKVKSASCTPSPVQGGATGVTANATTNSDSLGATFTMNFVQPGDSATCTVVYENCGSLTAAISHQAYSVIEESANPLTANGEGVATYQTADDGIEFTISGLNAGTLSAKTDQADGGTTTITIVGKYLDVTTGQGNATTKTASIRVSSSASQSV